MFERVKTGVKGLDKLLEGGFGKGFLVEVAGGVGTYKSTFGLQFAAEGIRNKENVTYISLEEPTESFRQLAKDLNVEEEFSKIDFRHLNTVNVIKTWYASKLSDSIGSLAMTILESLDQPDRLVLDSATTLTLYSSRTELKKSEDRSQFMTPGSGDIRIMLLYLAEELRKMKDCTSVLIAESGTGELYMAEEMLKYVCDGKIELRKTSLGTRSSRSLIIEKMRHTNHTLDELPFVLTTGGLSVEEIEQG